MMPIADGAPRRVLVTGSEGYIGSVVMPVLTGAGYDATGLDVGWFAEGRLVPPDGKWTTLRRDIRDIETEELRGFDAVVHLAAICNDPLGELDPELTGDMNYRATVRLAEVARKAGVARFLFSSSCSMYGVSAGGNALDETADFNPQTAYARSKVLAERELTAMAGDGDGFCPVMLRNATAYGISPRQRFDLVVPNLAGHAHVNGEVRLTSDGTPWRPLVHIRDIAAACLAILAAPRDVVRGQAYNIGRNADNYRIREIAEQVQKAYSNSQLTFGPPSPDNRSYRVDFTKAEIALPGFAPQWDLLRGVRECRSAFGDIGLDAATFEDRRYTRLKQIRHLLERGLIDERLRWREV
jgi:nucleoside-diphosphate-sugar epimerase